LLVRPCRYTVKRLPYSGGVASLTEVLFFFFSPVLSWRCVPDVVIACKYPGRGMGEFLANAGFSSRPPRLTSLFFIRSFIRTTCSCGGFFGLSRRNKPAWQEAPGAASLSLDHAAFFLPFCFVESRSRILQSNSPRLKE